MYLPEKEGTILELKHYDSKNQLTGTSTQKILKKTTIGKDLNVDVLVKAFNEKGNEETSKTLTMKCKDGVFMIDMKSLIPPEIKSNQQGMKIKVDGTDLKIPGKLSTGQKLEDCLIKISMTNQGMVMMSVTVKIINRKVESFEKITTPAGTFDCYKISQDIESKSVVNVKVHSIDWMAKNIGIVKNEMYDKSNKLSGYSILTAIR